MGVNEAFIMVAYAGIGAVSFTSLKLRLFDGKLCQLSAYV